MNNSTLFIFYGIFLIVCGIVAFSLIGKRAKTALLSGGSTGTLCLVIAYFMMQGNQYINLVGIVYTLLLLIVFGWRSSIAFLTIINSFNSDQKLTAVELKGKAVAFLIISVMFITSLILLILQLLKV